MERFTKIWTEEINEVVILKNTHRKFTFIKGDLLATKSPFNLLLERFF